MRLARAPSHLLAVALVLAAPSAARAGDVPFACPEEGRVRSATAPADYHAAPDARCIQGGLVELYDAFGAVYPRMTRVGPGWYLTAAGYAQADAVQRRVRAERDACRAELARVQESPPSEGAATGRHSGWRTGRVIALVVGTVLVSSYGGCRLAGGCRWFP